MFKKKQEPTLPSNIDKNKYKNPTDLKYSLSEFYYNILKSSYSYYPYVDYINKDFNTDVYKEYTYTGTNYGDLNFFKTTTIKTLYELMNQNIDKEGAVKIIIKDINKIITDNAKDFRLYSPDNPKKEINDVTSEVINMIETKIFPGVPSGFSIPKEQKLESQYNAENKQRPITNKPLPPALVPAPVSRPAPVDSESKDSDPYDTTSDIGITYSTKQIEPPKTGPPTKEQREEELRRINEKIRQMEEDRNSDAYTKYLKYKAKYLALKKELNMN